MSTGSRDAVRGLLRHPGWQVLTQTWRTERTELIVTDLKKARTLKQLARVQAMVAAMDDVLWTAERLADQEDET